MAELTDAPLDDVHKCLDILAALKERCTPAEAMLSTISRLLDLNNKRRAKPSDQTSTHPGGQSSSDSSSADEPFDPATAPSQSSAPPSHSSSRENGHTFSNHASGQPSKQFDRTGKRARLRGTDGPEPSHMGLNATLPALTPSYSLPVQIRDLSMNSFQDQPNFQQPPAGLVSDPMASPLPFETAMTISAAAPAAPMYNTMSVSQTMNLELLPPHPFYPSSASPGYPQQQQQQQEQEPHIDQRLFQVSPNYLQQHQEPHSGQGFYQASPQQLDQGFSQYAPVGTPPSEGLFGGPVFLPSRTNIGQTPPPPPPPLPMTPQQQQQPQPQHSTYVHPSQAQIPNWTMPPPASASFFPPGTMR